MLVFPNAKINLGLYVTGRRPDGYHNIESVFYPVPLTDVLEITREETPSGIKITGLNVDGESSNNLCVRAARLFDEKFGTKSSTIYLHKVIPMGAGLGGGSSDAAFTLRLLNDLYGNPASGQELFEMAMKLGSDCGFFILNKPCFVKGRGEVIEPVDLDLSGYHIMIVKPEVHVSTPEAYSMITPQRPVIDLLEAISQPMEMWKNRISNDFEMPVSLKHPVISRIRNMLYDMGALYASMSGSGSAVYGLFKQEILAPGDFPDCFTWKGKL